MKIQLDIKQLNEKQFAYLRQIFVDPAFEGDDFDSFYAYLTYLEDTQIDISGYNQIDAFSSTVIRIFNEVFEDYGNLFLSFVQQQEEPSVKIVMDIIELNKRGHEYLKELFEFPDYYGNNLDALYDCLCELDHTQVIVMNCDDLNKNSLKILDVFDEVSDEYGNITISYEFEEENQE